jgi:hypothetical protein
VRLTGKYGADGKYDSELTGKYTKWVFVQTAEHIVS